MIKVYKMNGKTESHEVFNLGKTVIKVTFTKGNLDPKNRVPAKYATESPVVQYAIEHDPRFGKTIFLDKVYGEVTPAAAPAASTAVAKGKGGKGKSADKGDTLKEMPEVTTLADAVTVLTAEGAPAADFDGTVEGALKIAKGLGLSFPNLKGE